MPRFGFWTLTFLVVANMIGAGVFTTSGFALQDLGSPALVVIAWAVGGVIALAGAASYGMLAQAMPESGGEYLFLSRAVHPLLGYIAGWTSLLAGFSGAIAFAATAFESFVLGDVSRPPWLPANAIAVLSIILAGVFHGLRPRLGASLQNVIVIVKLGLLAAVITAAFINLPPNAGQFADSLNSNLSNWGLASAFAGSLVWISLSYSGFNAAVYVAGEVPEAKKTIPLALVAGTSIVFILYLLLNYAFVFSGPLASLAGKPDVAAVAARLLGGEAFAALVRWTIAICLLTSIFSMMMAAPRVYAKMAEDGLLPARFKFQDDRPFESTALQACLAVLLVLASTLQGLLSYLGLTLSLSAACSAACLFLPTVRTRPLLHPIHLIPAFYVAATLLAGTLMVSFNPWQLVGTAATFGMGGVAYGLTRWRQRRENSLAT